jgi:hypothetical protein
LEVNGATTQHDIPGGLDTWSGTSGTLLVSTPGGGCGGGSYDLSGTVVDVLGARSSTASDSVTTSGGAGVTVTEVGDTGSDIQEIGTLAAPTLLCGNAWGAGNNGTEYTYDYDLVHFTVSGSGPWTFELTWAEPTGDYDLHLYDALGYIADYSEQDGPTQPEVIADWYVFSSEEYYLGVGAWSGGAGDWTVEVY